MCGIYGSITKQSSKDVVSNGHLALAEIKPRGPDADGACNFEVSNFNVNLIHARLTILDLSDAGLQPMLDEETKSRIIFNGEIYNFSDIKSELIKNYNIRFNSTGDTEVLLKSLTTKGLDQTLNFIDGMFAFAFYDAKNNELSLARDRFGEKPLYYYFDENQLYFSSDIRAIERTLNSLDALSDFTKISFGR